MGRLTPTQQFSNRNMFFKAIPIFILCSTGVFSACVPLPSVSFAVLSDPKLSYNASDTATYSCATGATRHNGTFETTCQPDESWSWTGGELVCLPVDCGVPDKLTNTNMTLGDTTYNAVVTYKCDWSCCEFDAPHEATVSYSRTCLANGKWSGDKVECKRRNCGDPGIPTHSDIECAATISNGFRYAQYVQYTAVDGFRLEPVDQKISCQYNKTWDGPTPTCEPVLCPTPAAIEHATLKITKSYYDFKEKINFECEVGYEVGSGDLVRSCQSDSTWSGAVSTCAPIHCGIPTTPEGSEREEGNSDSYGSTISYKCKEGFSASDTLTPRRCELTGNWSDEPPNCLRKPCPLGDFTEPENVTASLYRVEANTTVTGLANMRPVFGDVMHFACDTYNKRVNGSKRALCAAAGWEGWNPIRCEYWTAPENAEEEIFVKVEADSSREVGMIVSIGTLILVGFVILLDIMTMGPHFTVCKKNLGMKVKENE